MDDLVLRQSSSRPGTLTPAQIAELDKPLDPAQVKNRKGNDGTDVSYIRGHTAIANANRIFGYGNWQYDIVFVELNQVADDNGRVIGCYFAARVRLTVGNCQICEESGAVVGKATALAHIQARKSAITNALKRALRAFGDQFGNGLYNPDVKPNSKHPRGPSNASSEQPNPETQPPPQAKPTPTYVSAPTLAHPISNISSPHVGATPTIVAPVGLGQTDANSFTQQLNNATSLPALEAIGFTIQKASYLNTPEKVSLREIYQARKNELMLFAKQEANKAAKAIRPN